MSPRWLSLVSCAGLLCLLDCFGGSCSAAAENVTLCWGDGSYGQLGNGQGNFTEQSYNSSVPVEVVGGRSFAAVCSGEAHSCALEPSGAAWCWGDNQFSQLGTGDNVNSTTPVAVAGGRAFRSLTCGLGFTCALDSEDQAWCWGRNNYGQLGTGDQTSWKLPVEVALGRRFAALSAGAAHTCGVDLEGATFCWGLNEFGQLGAQLSSSDSFTPVEVTGNHTFVDVSSGLGHTCALEPPPSSRAWCWGWGTFGQLGNRETGDQRSPVLVAGNRAFSLISVGGGHSCALASNGATWCWGIANANGQGNATEQPRLVGGNHMFVTLTTGGLHTCALDVSKNAWCWGSNDTGWTGTGTLGTASTMPVQVAAGRSFLAIEAGDRHTCAIVAKAAGQDEVPSPQPSPVPSPSPPPDSSSSSSTPVGAIVGGTCAGAAVLAALAFFALRPRKGWLRRKRPPASVEDASSSDKDTMHDTPLKGSHGTSASMHHGGSSPPSTMPGAAASAASGSELGPGTLSPRSRVGDGVLLHLSSSGSGAGSTSAVAASPTHAALTQTDSQTSSSQAPASDALLSFISSYLSSYPRQTTQPTTPLQVGGSGSGSGSGGSGSLELLADPQLRNVQWPELTIVRRVGRGSFGSVYVAEWKRIHVAVKLLVSQDSIERGQLELPDKLVRDLHAEAAIMNRMRHPNVVQFMGVVDVPPALITEYCSRGSLYDCLATAREHATAAAQLTWRRRLAMAVDAGAGLLYLHSLSIIHRDVKSPNMLVDEHWRVKVADFNLSKLLENSSLTSTAATNPIWLAPEVLRGDKATTASDVYSFGMVLYELLTWRLPWTMAEMSPFKIAAVVRRGGRPEVPPREALPGPDTAGWDGLDDYVQLMRMCWAPQPEHRPSFDEVVQQLQLLKGAAPPDDGQAGRL